MSTTAIIIIISIIYTLVLKIPRVKKLKKKLEWLLVWTVDAEGIVQEHRIKTLDCHGDCAEIKRKFLCHRQIQCRYYDQGCEKSQRGRINRVRVFFYHNGLKYVTRREVSVLCRLSVISISIIIIITAGCTSA